MKGVLCFAYVTNLAGVAGDMVHHIKVTLTVFYNETHFMYIIMLSFDRCNCQRVMVFAMCPAFFLLPICSRYVIVLFVRLSIAN